MPSSECRSHGFGTIVSVVSATAACFWCGSRAQLDPSFYPVYLIVSAFSCVVSSVYVYSRRASFRLPSLLLLTSLCVTQETFAAGLILPYVAFVVVSQLAAIAIAFAIIPFNDGGSEGDSDGHKHKVHTETTEAKEN